MVSDASGSWGQRDAASVTSPSSQAPTARPASTWLRRTMRATMRTCGYPARAGPPFGGAGGGGGWGGGGGGGGRGGAPGQDERGGAAPPLDGAAPEYPQADDEPHDVLGGQLAAPHASR